jgi:hypothetical protein
MKVNTVEVRSVFSHRGRRCVVLYVNRGLGGHFNAYVETELKGQLYTSGDISPERAIECHGGVTFSGELLGDDKKKLFDGWFFGMDFAHLDDFIDEWPLVSRNPFGNGKRWTLKEVQEEAVKLCDEVLRYEELVKHG